MLRYKLIKEEHPLCITNTLIEAFTKRTLYSKDSHQYKAVTWKLAIFVGSSNVDTRWWPDKEKRLLIT